MKTRQQRLLEVYEHLRHTGRVHTQEDFAILIGAKRPGISAALNGNRLYLTDSLFNKICDSIPGTFSLDYLIHGEGDLLLNHGTFPMEPSLPINDNESIDREKDGTKNLLEICSSIIVEMENVLREQKKELAEIRAIKSELQQAHQKLIEAAENFRRINHQYNYPTATTSKAAEESPTNN